MTPLPCASSSPAITCSATPSASRRQRSAREALCQRLALDALEHQIGRAIEPFEAVDGGDVGMAEGGEHPRLALEAAQAAGIAAKGVGERLDRDLASEAGVERAVDAAHAAGAEQIEDLVASELLTEHEATPGAITRRSWARSMAPTNPLYAWRDSKNG